MDSSSKITSSNQSPFITATNAISEQQATSSSNTSTSAKSYQINAAVQKAIKQSSEARMTQIVSLQNAEQMQGLQKNLNQLRELSLNYANAVNQYDEGSENDDLEDQVKLIDSTIKQLIQKIVDDNKPLGIDKSWFASWWLLERTEINKRGISLDYFQEQILNRCVNRKCFLAESSKIVENHKEIIIKEFYSNNANNLDSNQISFELSPIASETHNRGKTPVKITFSSNKTELFSIVFKPRDARIDARVINLFNSLNSLDEGEKSIKVNLPVYKIINVNNNSEPYSLWEFIKTAPGLNWPGSTASQSINVMNRNEQLLVQLTRLESVCKYLNISDLHTDNLILASPNQKDIQIVPIDLESIQEESATGLFINPPHLPKFTDAEEQLLKKCKTDIGNVPTRFVPIATSDFLSGLVKYDSYVKIAKSIVDSITRKGYSLMCSADRLEWLILEDFLCNDTPYLAEFQNQIFYGSINNTNLIARRTLK